MRQYQVDCFLLHIRPYRETSVIATALSRELGKVSCVVKGVRNKKGHSRGLLQPFVPLQMQLTGQSELKTGSKIEMQGKALALNGKHLYSGMYLNEVLIRALPTEEALPELFECYSQVLIKLAEATEIEPLLRSFEFYLLQVLGYGIDFSVDAQHQQVIDAEKSYQFHPELGFSLATDNQQYAISGKTLMAIEQEHWTPEALKAAKYVARIALTPLLGNKPLKSRELFR